MNRAATGRTVVCLGDSNTEGVAGASYVDLVRSRLEHLGIRVTNRGMGGDLAENVGRRLATVLADEPDAVVLLVGTNDVAAHISPVWLSDYRREQQIVDTPTRQTYRAELVGILSRLSAQGIRVILVHLPPMGEDLDAPINVRVREYNEIVDEVAMVFETAVVPFYDAMAAAVKRLRAPRRWDESKEILVSAREQHDDLGRSWNEIGEDNGFQLFSDGIHLNERSAQLLAGLVEQTLWREFAD